MATRCTTAQQFIETFHRFCDEQSFFVATMNMRQVGLETPFSIQLADKTPVLQGLCVVLAAWTTGNNPHKRPGIRLGIRRLTPESEAIFYQLQAMRTATPQEAVTEAVDLPDIPPLPVAAGPARPTPPPVPARRPPLPAPVAVQPVVEEQRTPGSELVLPANPLSNLTDQSIEGFVDCTLYEETANFFGAPEDDVDVDEPAPPPKPETVDVLPEFRPSAVIAAAFDADSTATVTVAEPVTQPVSPVSSPIDPAVVASLARVEHSVMRLVETLDTSRPIDELPRETPIPAGEAYARQVAKRARRHSKWLVIGGAATVATAAAIGLWVTRSAADEQRVTPLPAPRVAKAPVEPPVTPPPPVEPPVAEPPPPVGDKPASDDEVDGDELAAVPGTPVAGDGPCKLEVTTTPAGTMVQIDGKPIGPSPLTIAGPCARTRVDLVHPRYKAEQRFVTPAPDRPGKVDVTLVRPTHTLTVITKPAGAKISIAGRRAGTSPTKVQLMGFSGLEVKIEKPGFETVTRRIYSKQKADSLSVTLKRSLWVK